MSTPSLYNKNYSYDSSKSHCVTIQEQKNLTKQSMLESTFCSLVPNYNKYQLQTKLDSLSATLKNNPDNEKLKNKIYDLQAKLIYKYKDDKSLRKIIIAAERILIASDNEYDNFIVEENKKSLNQWNRYAGPNCEEIFKKHPEFSHWLINSKLLSQMKIFPNPNGIRLNNEGKPEIRVTLFQKDTPWNKRQTTWMPFEQFKIDFSFEYSEKRETTIITHNKTKNIYTFLGNGKALQSFDPWDVDYSLAEAPVPITILDDNQILEAQQTACQFPRDNHENSPHDYVLQVVSSYVSGKGWNSTKLLQQSKHPYTRVIVTMNIPNSTTVKGGVYVIGFGWQTGKGDPLKVKDGQFTFLDSWEYKSCLQKVVTNIPITAGEATSFFNFMKRYHTSSVRPAFHLIKQNCSVYVEQSIQHLNITQNGRAIAPTSISFSNLATRITPNCLKSIEEPTLKPSESTTKQVPKAASPTLEEPTTVVFDPGTLFPVSNLKFTFQSKYHLPGILQEWQLKQESTRIFNSPQYLTIIQTPDQKNDDNINDAPEKVPSEPENDYDNVIEIPNEEEQNDSHSPLRIKGQIHAEMLAHLKSKNKINAQIRADNNGDFFEEVLI